MSLYYGKGRNIRKLKIFSWWLTCSLLIALLLAKTVSGGRERFLKGHSVFVLINTWRTVPPMLMQNLFVWGQNSHKGFFTWVTFNLIQWHCTICHLAFVHLRMHWILHEPPIKNCVAVRNSKNHDTFKQHLHLCYGWAQYIKW